MHSASGFSRFSSYVGESGEGSKVTPAPGLDQVGPCAFSNFALMRAMLAYSVFYGGWGETVNSPRYINMKWGRFSDGSLVKENISM